MTKFTLFNLEHSLTIIATGIIFGLIIWISRFKFFQKHHLWIGRSIATVLIGHLIYFHSYLLSNNQFSFQNNLPFHLCSISSYLIILAILYKNQILLQFTFFLTLSGSILALLLPNLHSNDVWGSFGFTEFFVSHSFIIFGWAYLWASRQFDIRYHHLWIVYGSIAVYATMVYFVINPAFDANYIYLKQIPQNRQSLTFGAPPLHIINMSWLVLLFLHVQYWLYKKTYPKTFGTV